MKPDPRFIKQPKTFWACVRSLSQHIGYSKKNSIIVPSARMMADAFADLNLDPTKIIRHGKATALATQLEEYFSLRAERLVEHIEPHLLLESEAKKLFKAAKREWAPKCPLPMNKQKGNMKAEAYLTCLVNILVEAHSDGLPCNYNPLELTTITKDGQPVRTLARRVDGAFPTPVNPIAVWEVKEYYYTTTFGSRVADGVYESLLDGIEIEELRENEGIDVKHYLMVDAHFTWWIKGKAYLCRIVDMLHMGYVDEVLFGREVIDEMPRIVREWVKLAKSQGKQERPTRELPKR
jgi:hypothetical protein